MMYDLLFSMIRNMRAPNAKLRVVNCDNFAVQIYDRRSFTVPQPLPSLIMSIRECVQNTRQ